MTFQAHIHINSRSLTRVPPPPHKENTYSLPLLQLQPSGQGAHCMECPRTPQLMFTPAPAILSCSSLSRPPKDHSACTYFCSSCPTRVAPVQNAPEPSAHTCYSYSQPAKVARHTSLHRGCSYTRPFLLYQETEMFHLIHRQEHRN